MIKVLISADSKYPVDRKRIRKLVGDFLKEQGVISNMSVGVTVVGDRKMKVLNEKWMNHEGTTDVLSFPEIGDEKTRFVEPKDMESHLGDLVVSWPQAVKQALERNKKV
jgi:probable rRNA maturation factor